MDVDEWGYFVRRFVKREARWWTKSVGLASAYADGSVCLYQCYHQEEPIECVGAMSGSDPRCGEGDLVIDVDSTPEVHKSSKKI